MTQSLAVFRADASADLGAGHVMRCLTLAGALQAAGWDIAFVCSAETLGTVPALRQRFRCTVLSSADLLVPDAVRAVAPSGCALAVVDHYGIDGEFESRLRGWARNILAIDDLANRSHAVDVLLDQTYGRLSAHYAGLVPDECVLLLGSDFALLRSEFRELRQFSLGRRGEAHLRRVLVSAGATDPQNVTWLALDAFTRSKVNASICVAIGSAAPHLRTVESAIAALPCADLCVDAEDMAKLMTNADLAIGACGSSSWERCCLGLPAIAVMSAPDQTDVGRALAGAGAAVVTELSGLHADWMAMQLREFAASPEVLRTMARRAAALCDGLGAQRAARAIATIAEGMTACG